MADDVTAPVPAEEPAPPPAAAEAAPVPPVAQTQPESNAAAPAHEPPHPSLAHGEEPDAPPATPDEPAAENLKRWYVVKVQSGREDTIKEAIERRVRKEGLEDYFGQIVIPVEKVTEVKTDKAGKRVTRSKERKLYPGYLMVEVEYNDRILYLFRETSGVGDFVGAHPGNLQREPTPMSEREIQRMLGPVGGKGTGDEPKDARLNPPPKWMDTGDRVRVVDGTFNGMEGVVKEILDAVGKVKVDVSIFGRPVSVELDYYQVEEV